MRIAARLTFTGIALCVVSLFATSAFAQDQRVGFFGQSAAGAFYPCPEGKFLVGITARKTDRIIGMSFACVTPKFGPAWTSANDVGIAVGKNNPIGDTHGGTAVNTTCPRDHFLIGFAGTVGRYRGPGGIGAKAVPAQLVADLAPVCRNAAKEVVQFPRGRLWQADDNELQDIPWDGQNGARTCKPGEAAIGLYMSYQAGANLDPNYRFGDVSLVCKRLPPPTPVISTTTGSSAGGSGRRGGGPR